MSEVKIDFAEFASAHEGLEASRVELGGVKRAKTETRSTSEAMDAFADKAKKIEALIRSYEALLQKDSLALLSASTIFADTDSYEAARYAESIYGSNKMCPNEGSAYYDSMKKWENASLAEKAADKMSGTAESVLSNAADAAAPAVLG